MACGGRAHDDGGERIAHLPRHYEAEFRSVSVKASRFHWRRFLVFFVVRPG
jgi:hypothetical protein